MRVGLTLAGANLSRENARFASQLGVKDIVVHLVPYHRNADASRYLAGAIGPDLGDCSDEKLWSYEDFAGAAAMLAEFGISIAALENLSPNFWSDVLLDGPARQAQMEGLKRLIQEAGRAGIPVIGYNFSIAGVWGWQRQPLARGGAMTASFSRQPGHDEPMPDGLLWNMRYRAGRPDAAPVAVSEAELWQRLERFLAEIVPVAEEAGVVLAAHPDDPPADSLRGTARLVNRPEKYDRLLAAAPSPANKLEFCIGSLAEMPGSDICATTRHYARRGAIAYVHFRNVRGQMPAYHESFVDDGDVDMAEIIRILHEESFDGVLVPDHVPELACPAPWHAGHAHAVGYIRALTQHAAALGPARTPREVKLADLTRTPAIAPVPRRLA